MYFDNPAATPHAHFIQMTQAGAPAGGIVDIDITATSDLYVTVAWDTDHFAALWRRGTSLQYADLYCTY